MKCFFRLPLLPEYVALFSFKLYNFIIGTPLDNDCNCTIWIIIAVIVIVLASVIAITYAYPYCKKKMEKYKLVRIVLRKWMCIL